MEGRRPKGLRLYQRVIESGLIFLLVFTPLALGAVHFWSIALAELIVVGLAFVWLLEMFFSSSRSALSVPKGRLASLPFLLFFGLILFQWMPLPPSVLRLISPGTHELYQQTLPGWPEEPGSRGAREQGGRGARGLGSGRAEEQGSGGAAGPGVVSPPHLRTSAPPPKTPHLVHSLWRSISVYRHATRTELLRLLSIVAVYFLVAHYLRSRCQIDRLAIAVILVASFEAVYGLLGYLSGGFFFLGRRERWDMSSAVGTFVNRNHFAGYLELALPLSLGFLLSRLPPPDPRRSGWRGRLLDLEIRLAHHVPLLVAIVVMFLAVIFSRSRMGIFSMLAALSTMGLMWRFRRGGEKRARAIWGLLWIGLLSAAWIGLGPVVERFTHIPDEIEAETGRLAVWRDSLNLLKTFPVLGSGLGTYEHLFPRYKAIQYQLSYEHAHNDYLELATDTGLAGFALILTGMALFVRRLGREWARKQDPYSKGMALGGLMGLLAFSLHSLTDFNLHILANPLLLSAMLGLTSSVLYARYQEPLFLHPSPGRLPGSLRVLFGMGATVLAYILVSIILRSSLAERDLSRAENASGIVLSLLTRATLLDPQNSETHYQLGRAYLDRKVLGDRKKLLPQEAEQARRAQMELERAIALNPASGLYHARLGWALTEGEPETDSNRLLNMAEEEFEQALRLDATNALLYHLYARWCLKRAEESQGKAAVLYARPMAKKGLDLYRTAFRMDPALEARSETWLDLGRLYRLVGEYDRAQELFLKALRVDPPNPALRYELARLHWEQGRIPQAMEELWRVARLSVPDSGGLHEVLLQALEGALTKIPDSRARWHYRLAKEYQRAGALEKSFDHLRAALTTVPFSAVPSSAFLADAEYRFGLILEGRGQVSEALTAYRRAADLLPSHRQTLLRMQVLSREGKGVMKDGPAEIQRKLADLTPAHPLGIYVFEEVRLLGYDLDASDLFVSGRFTLTLYWECWEELSPDDSLEVRLKEKGQGGREVRPLSSESLQSTNFPPGGVIKTPYRFTQGKALGDLLTEGKSLNSESLARFARATIPPKTYSLQVSRRGSQGAFLKDILVTIKVP